jgi:hypothetical protein
LKYILQPSSFHGKKAFIADVIDITESRKREEELEGARRAAVQKEQVRIDYKSSI